MEEKDYVLVEIFTLCHLINKHSNFKAFFDYSGHVNLVGIRIGKWKKEQLEISFKEEFYHKVNWKNQNDLEVLNKVKEKLIDFIDEKEIHAS